MRGRAGPHLTHASWHGAMTRQDLLDYIQQVRSGVDAAVHMVDESNLNPHWPRGEKVAVEYLAAPEDARRHSFRLLLTRPDWTPDLVAQPSRRKEGLVYWTYKHDADIYLEVVHGDPGDRHFEPGLVVLPDPLGQVESLRSIGFEAIYRATPTAGALVSKLKQLFGRQAKGRARLLLLPGLHPDPVPLMPVATGAMRWFEAAPRRVFSAARLRSHGDDGLWMKTRKVVGRDGKESEETIVTHREPAAPAERVTGRFAYPVGAGPFWNAAD